MYESVKGKGDTLTQPALFSFSTRNRKKKAAATTTTTK